MKKKTEIVNQSENTEVFVRTSTEKRTHKKPSKKKIFITIAIVAVVIAGVAIFLSTRETTAPPVMVSTGSVERMNIEETVAIRGTVEGSENAEVSSASNSKITAVYVKEGDFVQKDQVLATLDVSDARDRYNQAALSLRESQRAYETAETLYNEGAISQEEYLKSKAAYESDSLNLSAIDISDEQNIRSPITGTVTRVNVTVGRYASDTAERGQSMFMIENLEDLQMNVRISEYDISKIQVGQAVEITAEVLGNDSVTGTVSNISPTGEAKDASSTEKVIPVVIAIDKSEKTLIAGVTARATIMINRSENALAIPIDAIIEDPETGENSVFIVEEGVLHKAPVTIGIESALNIEVTEGEIAEGDAVVLAPTFELQDGAQVVVMPGM